jgi:hypothetical protein
MAPKKNNNKRNSKTVKKANQTVSKPTNNPSITAALPKQSASIYFNDGSPDVWIIKGKQRIDDEAAKEGIYDFLVTRTRTFGRAPKDYLYHARAIAVEAYETELKKRIEKKLEFWLRDNVLYCAENALPLFTAAAFAAQTLTDRTTNATNVTMVAWGTANRLTSASTEAEIRGTASDSTLYKIDLAVQSSNDSFERSEKENTRIKSIACKILNERLGPNALAAGRASLDAQDYARAYQDIHMHFLNSSVHSGILMNQQLNDLAMKKNETLNIFLRRAYDLFKIVHVSALIAKARAALVAAGLTTLTIVPGLDQAMIERICTLNSDVETESQPAPYNTYVTGDLVRVTHILSGLRNDPDETFRTVTDQFANTPNQCMKTLVYMLESFTHTFDFHQKREARQKALQTNTNQKGVTPQVPSNNNKTGRFCKWCKKNRPLADPTTHDGPFCYFDPASPKYKPPKDQKGDSSNKEKAATALKAAQKLVAKAAKEKANAKAARNTLKAAREITEAEILPSSDESD